MQLARYIIAALLLFPAISNAADKLIQSSDMAYVGAFKLPPNNPDNMNQVLYETDGIGHGLAFRPVRAGAPNGSLFMAGNYYYNRVMEMAIPTPVNSGSLAILPRATLLQPFTDIASSIKNCLYSSPACTNKEVRLGGLLVYNNELIGTSYNGYDGAEGQVLSHFKSPLTLSVNSATGMYAPSLTTKARSMAGEMAVVPAAWQGDSALGGKILTGLHDISISSATSYMPAAFTLDPANFSTSAPFNVNALMYVDTSHTVYGSWSNTTPANAITSNADGFGGVVFPEGSKSVLYIRAHGNGPSCYGTGTTDPSKAFVTDGTCGLDTCCYDLENYGGGSHGTHSYPYVYHVLAYSADDLAAVKAGTLAHNSVVPYAHWELSLPNTASTHMIAGVAYDKDTQRVYISQASTEGNSPIIQVYQLNLTPSVAPTVTDGIKVRANRVKAHIQ